MHHQQPQEIELAGGKLDRAAFTADLTGPFVHDNVLDLQLWSGGWIPPAHHRPNSRQQLAEIKRLDQVIVGADLQSLDPVLDLVFGREDDDARILVAPNRLGDLESIELRHHHVEHHHVRLELTDQP